MIAMVVKHGENKSNNKKKNNYKKEEDSWECIQFVQHFTLVFQPPAKLFGNYVLLWKSG